MSNKHKKAEENSYESSSSNNNEQMPMEMYQVQNYNPCICCPMTYKNEDRSPRDVDKVVRMIEKDAKKELNELERIGINPRILNYFINSMASYIDRNYNRYNGPLDKKIQAAEKDLRRDLYWIFDILRVISASPVAVARLTEIIVRISFKHLKPLQQSPPGSPPMPRY